MSMNRRQLFLTSARGALASALAAVGFSKTARAQAPTATAFPDSKVLPTPTPPFGGDIEPNLVDSAPGWTPTITPPAGAPNVLLVLIDDAGFGSNSVFGGVVPTPTLEKLAKGGIRYTQMHNTALCSPTRAALLTGRNHHVVGFGNVAEAAMGYPGYDFDHPAGNGAYRDDPQGERLRHRLDRQEPQRADLAGLAAGSVRALAERTRIRLFLRLRRRRHEPVAARQPLSQHDADPPIQRQAGLEPQHRARGRSDRIYQHADRDQSEAALVHPLCAGRDARAAPSDQGMGRQDQRDASVRRRLERGGRTHLREPEEARRRAGERQAAALAGFPGQVGDAVGGRQKTLLAPDRRSGPPIWPTPITRSAA